ncbi:MAG: DUF2271 domain-containing protein [Flavobacteriales bacterium]
MKSILLSVSLFACTLLQAQTQGTLAFTFTQTSHTSYSGSRNVLAVWIQSSTGTFIKTRMRYAGGGTSDHLPTWAVNSGGTSGNCMSGSCNTVGATTGATLTSFGTRSVTWDGTDASGNVVADGTYKITIESCWNHGSTAKVTRSFTFTKGTAPDVQTPTADANFTAIGLAWNPAGVGVTENAPEMIVSIHPNPSTSGIFTVDFNQATKVTAMNLAGEEVFAEDVKINEVSKSVNLSNMSNGVYFICVANGTAVSKHKVVINK